MVVTFSTLSIFFKSRWRTPPSWFLPIFNADEYLTSVTVNVVWNDVKQLSRGFKGQEIHFWCYFLHTGSRSRSNGGSKVKFDHFFEKYMYNFRLYSYILFHKYVIVCHIYRILYNNFNRIGVAGESGACRQIWRFPQKTPRIAVFSKLWNIFGPWANFYGCLKPHKPVFRDSEATGSIPGVICGLRGQGQGKVTDQRSNLTILWDNIRIILQHILAYYFCVM